MKTLLLFLSLVTSQVSAMTEVKHFNDVLIKNVQQDIQNDNDDQFRKKSVGRGPASVESEPEGRHIEQEKKIDKNVRQLGNQKW